MNRTLPIFIARNISVLNKNEYKNRNNYEGNNQINSSSSL